MTDRVSNFSAGPAVLPLPVLKQIQTDLLALPGVGMSVLEIPHRGQAFKDILHSAKANLKTLLGVPDNYRILFLQGGSRLQFSMVPLNLLRKTDKSADYVLTGSWGIKAREQAEREGAVRVAWDGKSTSYSHVPTFDQLDLDPNAAYVHITSNETIQGVQFGSTPDTGPVPLVCDASSDFLSRPMPVQKYGLIYACAQKNAGPAGVTIVMIRDDLLQHSDDSLPEYLNYQTQADNDSLYNTPPTFAVYVVSLVARWIIEQIGGLGAIEAINRKKSQLLYRVIDESNGFYRGHARPESRSMMNVTFRLPNDQLEQEFLADAQRCGLRHLNGHRSVGGIRASIYNAMPLADVESLRDFMRDFSAKHRG